MEICMHATHQAILCILFIVASWAHVNAQRHRSDENISRGVRSDTIGFDEGKDTLLQLRITLEKIKQDCEKLEASLVTHTRTLEYLEEDIGEIKKAATKEERNTRALQKDISSLLDSQTHYEEEVNLIRSELAGVKHELVEDRNSLHQKFMAPLEILNQTVQLIAHKQDEAFSQVAELKAEQQQQMALVLQALQETSQLKGNYTSEIAMLKAEQKEQASAAFKRIKDMEEALLQISQFPVGNYTSKADQREKRAISNKCSLNVHHKPEGGRIDVLMVMDPPNTDSTACN